MSLDDNLSLGSGAKLRANIDSHLQRKDLPTWKEDADFVRVMCSRNVCVNEVHKQMLSWRGADVSIDGIRCLSKVATIAMASIGLCQADVFDKALHRLRGSKFWIGAIQRGLLSEEHSALHEAVSNTALKHLLQHLTDANPKSCKRAYLCLLRRLATTANVQYLRELRKEIPNLHKLIMLPRDLPHVLQGILLTPKHLTFVDGLVGECMGNSERAVKAVVNFAIGRDLVALASHMLGKHHVSKPNFDLVKSSAMLSELVGKFRYQSNSVIWARYASDNFAFGVALDSMQDAEKYLMMARLRPGFEPALAKEVVRLASCAENSVVSPSTSILLLLLRMSRTQPLGQDFFLRLVRDAVQQWVVFMTPTIANALLIAGCSPAHAGQYLDVWCVRSINKGMNIHASQEYEKFVSLLLQRVNVVGLNTIPDTGRPVFKLSRFVSTLSRHLDAVRLRLVTRLVLGNCDSQTVVIVRLNYDVAPMVSTVLHLARFALSIGLKVWVLSDAEGLYIRKILPVHKNLQISFDPDKIPMDIKNNYALALHNNMLFIDKPSDEHAVRNMALGILRCNPILVGWRRRFSDMFWNPRNPGFLALRKRQFMCECESPTRKRPRLGA
jgi:hypothetical protein